MEKKPSSDTRRNILTTIAGGTAMALAGCIGGSDGDDEPESEPTDNGGEDTDSSSQDGPTIEDMETYVGRTPSGDQNAVYFRVVLSSTNGVSEVRVTDAETDRDRGVMSETNIDSTDVKFILLKGFDSESRVKPGEYEVQLRDDSEKLTHKDFTIEGPDLVAKSVSADGEMLTLTIENQGDVHSNLLDYKATMNGNELGDPQSVVGLEFGDLPIKLGTGEKRNPFWPGTEVQLTVDGILVNDTGRVGECDGTTRDMTLTLKLESGYTKEIDMKITPTGEVKSVDWEEYYCENWGVELAE